jgi:predicted RNase H-like nuclease (RuvC/YqgF family)
LRKVGHLSDQSDGGSAPNSVRLDALQETVGTLMKQLQVQGSKLMDMELREQKILADLRAKCERVLELEMALDSRDEGAQASARFAKKERLLRSSNEALTRKVTELDDKVQQLEQLYSQAVRDKQVCVGLASLFLCGWEGTSSLGCGSGS